MDKRGKEFLKTPISGIVIALLLTSILAARFNVQPARGERIIVPDYYPTIQEAINHANTGDTVYVRSGTYYENIVVNKTVSLIGEDKLMTAIDGSGAGNVVYVTVDGVTITGFTIRASGIRAGIHLELVQSCDIYGNRVVNNFEGFDIWNSSGNSIHGNDIVAGEFGGGFYLLYSSNNEIYENNIRVLHGCNFDFRASLNNSVYRNNISSGFTGFDMSRSSDNNIYENNIVNNRYGIFLGHFCSNNTICANNIVSNEIGVSMEFECSANRICHNCFANNTNDAQIWRANLNLWDDGYPAGGNYWSSYTGMDNFSGPYQNQTGCDGIGDAPHEIAGNNVDRYPLIKALKWIVLGDVNYDFKVDMSDISLAVDAFLSYSGHPSWNPKADVDNNNSTDMVDVSIVIDSFMKF
jgi:parallel beta-helix repeat protein